MSSMAFPSLVLVALMDGCTSLGPDRICPSQSPFLKSRVDRYFELVVFKEGTWNEAKHDCISKVGYLADISSGHENKIIWDYLHSTRYFGDQHTGVWIGLTDVAEEGIWQWMSLDVENHFSNWAPNQPEANIEVANKEDCVLMESDGKWHDYPCESKHGWVCVYTNLTDGCLPRLDTVSLF